MLAFFQKLLKVDLMVLKTDVHKTKDGVLVLCHDEKNQSNK